MSVVETLRRVASERGLGTLSSILARVTPPASDAFEFGLPPDARLDAPPHAQPDQILGQLARRGLDPALIRALLAKWSDRPLERALVAWDTLEGALFAPGDPFLVELRAAIRPLRAILTKGCIDLNRQPAARLVVRYGGALEQATEVELLTDAFGLKLAAFAELSRRGDVLARKPGTFDSLRAFGGLLHLARLPTLSSVVLDLASRGLRHRPAALDLCEVLFDALAPEKIPGDAIQKGDLPEAQLADAAEYLVYRTWLAAGEWRKARALLEDNLRERDPARPPPSTRLVAVRAHLASLVGEHPVPLAILDEICDLDRLWRHGSRCRVVTAAAQSTADSPRPLALLHDHTSGFGPDFLTWSEALLVAPPEAAWRKESLRLLARETLALPHHPALWRLVAIAVATGPDLERAAAEITARLASQTA